MKCEEYEEKISELLDRELDMSRSGQLFAHLSTCEGCRTFFNSIQHLRGSLLDGALIHEPGRLEARMQRHFPKIAISANPDRHPVGRIFRKRYTISVAATILFLCTIIAGTALVSTSFIPTPRVVERRVHETIYVLQLPQVEIKGYYSGAVKSN